MTNRMYDMIHAVAEKVLDGLLQPAESLSALALALDLALALARRPTSKNTLPQIFCHAHREHIHPICPGVRGNIDRLPLCGSHLRIIV